MVTPTTLKALQTFARVSTFGTTLTGNLRGLSERAKLRLLGAGLIEASAHNPSLYHLSAKGKEILVWAQRPIFGAEK